MKNSLQKKDKKRAKATKDPDWIIALRNKEPCSVCGSSNPSYHDRTLHDNREEAIADYNRRQAIVSRWVW